ncbi:MAG: DNA-3-methyladenine glycosylase I [Alphaproteobacteria bacterium]|nr:DNA-3-methyladenine glycosylase I [Alphaproteobacteria bacterium]MCL2505752.1 DNA-3-methyladenine glycosylase I [Alphaproteobacteria bacterium]
MSFSYCKTAPLSLVHSGYHENEYGFVVKDESLLFERLSLEIMQAGLSWETVLKKRKSLNLAFQNFDAHKVASFSEKDVARLLNDASIIRNKRKILAIIHNASVILNMREEVSGFYNWLVSHKNNSKNRQEEILLWTKLFKKTFHFTGAEIVSEFLMSTGIISGAHETWCPVYQRACEHNLKCQV